MSEERDIPLDPHVTHVRLLFPKKYLAAEDLMGKGDITLTISRITLRDLKTERGTDRCKIVHFKEMDERPIEKRKWLVLNTTNANLIAKATGTANPHEWAGKTISLYATTCEAFGKTVDCIRVRANGRREEQDPNDLF